MKSQARRDKATLPCPPYLNLDTVSIAKIAGSETLHTLFRRQARLTPERVAVVLDQTEVTYGELDHWSDRLAHQLIERGVELEDFVGIYMTRSIPMVGALLATLKAGAAYVPIDPAYPKDRISFMVDDADAKLLLTDESHHESAATLNCETLIVDGMSADNAPVSASDRAGPRNLAYMIYTSGSTGTPKGAMIEHRSIINRLLWQQTFRPISEHDAVLQKTTFSFDVSVWELFLPLITGGRLVLARHGGQQDPDYLIDTIRGAGITHLHFVPSMLRAFLETPGAESCTGIKHIICSGEALPADLVSKCHRRLPATLENLYGPTEAAVDVTWWHCRRDWTERTIPIGQPVANTHCYILDSELRPVKPGETGELHIGGVQLARGYNKRPRLTAERFLPDPFESFAEARMYKTGDLARERDDGWIEFLGRIDHQVKIRGFRIEPGEIESVLNRHPAVREAVVVPDTSSAGLQLLTAYLVLARETTPSVSDLRNHLLDFLPDYMIPTGFLAIGEMPHNQSGKLDRNALAQCSTRSLETGLAFVAPKTETEVIIAAVWARVLGLERVGREDDFIELGGHSLGAMRIAADINRALDIQLSLTDVFSANTVCALAEKAERFRERPSSQNYTSLVPVDRAGPLPLSNVQRNILLETLRDPEKPIYNEPSTIRFDRPVSASVLEDALNELIRRHEILRTTYVVEDGEPKQVIQPDGSLKLATVDVRGEPIEKREEASRSIAGRSCSRPFDLTRSPLLRAVLVILDAADWRLHITIHHIASDAFSTFGLLLGELREIYRAFERRETPQLATPKFQYADFASWQIAARQGPEIERQIEFWRENLRGATGLTLRGDQPRPPVFSYRGSCAYFKLSREQTAAIHLLARTQRVTPFVTLLAAFQVLMHHESGSDDIVIGSVSAGRDHPDTARMLGCFLNYVVLRTDLSGEPEFAEVLKRAKKTVLDAAANQDVPLDRLVDALKPRRALDRHPFYQIMFLMEPPSHDVGDGWSINQLEFHAGTTKLDLTVEMDEIGGEFTGRVEYSTDIFHPSTIDRLITGYKSLLESVTGSPSSRISSISLLSAEDRQRILHDWNQTAFPHPTDALLHRLIESQGERSPNAIAVSCERESLTYRELNDRSKRLAHHLVSLGVGPDLPVAVCLKRSCDMVVSILAVLEAGGAFAPFDVTYPSGRISMMLDDLHPRVVISKSDLLDRLPPFGADLVDIDRDREKLSGYPATGVSAATSPEHLAYIIYTSGSTGEPKGVMVPHRAICNHMLWMQRAYPLSNDDAVLQKTACSFDASLWEFFAPLLAGARLVLARAGDPNDPRYLVSVITEHNITRLQLVPSVLEMLLEEPEFVGAQLPLRDLFCGGEALKPALGRAFVTAFPGTALHNLYGPAETTIDATAWDFDAAADPATVPIGRPIDNMRMYVVDRYMNPVPAGVSGELIVGGAGVARGYWNKPELTAESFIADPFSGHRDQRVYRTGDLVRFRTDGVLEYLGRNDSQIKIRGIRIEPAEIETALTSLSDVAQAAVVAVETPGLGKILAAYVTPADKTKPPRPSDLLAGLRRLLPVTLIPNNITVLPKLPLGPSGKLDRQALPRPESNTESNVIFDVGDDPVSGVLAAIWNDVLGIRNFDPTASFFELGGHSLQAIRLLSRVRSVLQARIALPDFLREATFQTLAARIRETHFAQPLLMPALTTRAARPTSAPLSSGQRQLWFLHHVDASGTGHNVVSILRLCGSVDAAALDEAIAAMVVRHEALRTIFPIANGEPVQVVGPAASDGGRCLTRETTANDESLERALERVLSEENGRRFDLEHGPLLSARLISDTSGDNHALVLNVHHIIADEPSQEILFHDIAHAYSQAVRPDFVSNASPQIGMHPSDFALWERAPERGEQRRENLDWWRRILTGAPPLLDLPLDRPRPATQAFKGSRVFHTVPKSVSSKIDRISRENSATPFMVFLAAWSSFLGRLCRQSDIVVGAPVSLRSLGPLEHTVGFFLNTLPFRIDLATETPSFKALVEQARDVAVDVYAHADTAFDELVETLQPERLPGVPPIYQAMLVMRGAANRAPSMAGVETSITDHHPDSAKLDMTLLVGEQNDAYELTLEFRDDLFEAQTATGWLECFAAYLERLVQQPDQPATRAICVSDTERGRLACLATGKRVDAGKVRTLSGLVASAAQTAAETTAVRMAGAPDLTHGDLDLCASRLAGVVRRRIESNEPRIAVCFDRSPGLIAAILAAMKTGGAYVPVDPSWPDERIRWIFEDSGVEAILAAEGPIARRMKSIASAFGETICPVIAVDPLNPGTDLSAAHGNESRAAPGSVSYIIYTSGSTGRPKGVLVEHCNAVASTLARHHVYGSEPPRFLLISPAVFDSSVAGLFWTLSAGGTLVLPPPGAERDPDALAAIIEQKGVTHYLCLPSLHDALLNPLKHRTHSLDTVVVAGEPCPNSLPAKHRDHLPGVKLINEYGPTETTVWSTWCEITNEPERRSIPIGRPIPGARVHVVDQGLCLLPRGGRGEIVVAGPGLSRGYSRLPELTADRFVAGALEHVGETRIYRTGDLGRWRSDGQLEFLGRIDDQVKIRGYRIEPGEIEFVVREHPDVADAAIVVEDHPTAGKRLIGHVVTEPSAQEDVLSDLKSFLANRLPEYMIPTIWASHSTIPKTASGKVDRRYLAEMRIDAQASDASIEPRTETERRLANLWQGLLGTESTSITDDFFKIGGHSLMAVRLQQEIENEFKTKFPLATLLLTRSIETMAKVLENPGEPRVTAGPKDLRGHGAGTPLFNIPGFGGIGIMPPELARAVSTDRKYFDGIALPGTDGSEEALDRIENIATTIREQICRVQPAGPYALTGFCLGGVFAYEVAQQLMEAGEEVRALILWHTFPFERWRKRGTAEQLLAALKPSSTNGTYRREDLLRQVWRRTRNKLSIRFRRATRQVPAAGDSSPGPDPWRDAQARAQADYRLAPYHGPIRVIRATRVSVGDTLLYEYPPDWGWRDLARGSYEMLDFPCDHMELIKPPNLQRVVDQTAAWLREADKTAGS